MGFVQCTLPMKFVKTFVLFGDPGKILARILLDVFEFTQVSTQLIFINICSSQYVLSKVSVHRLNLFLKEIIQQPMHKYFHLKSRALCKRGSFYSFPFTYQFEDTPRSGQHLLDAVQRQETLLDFGRETMPGICE